MSSFPLQIVTPEGLKLDGEAEALHLCTSEGYVSIRARHTDYIATLDVGIVTVTAGGKTRKAACGGGFLTVSGGQARLLATSFEYGEDIDVVRARAAQKRAEDRIAAAKEAGEIDLAKAKLARALNRLKAAEE